MPAHNTWQHQHQYTDDSVQAQAERRTRWVIALTLATMVVELIAGYLTGSMALTADGWHMGSHVAALAISAFAYAYSRHHAQDPRFTFGTGKVSALAGFASALVLGLIALLIAWESAQRFIVPRPIRFDEALIVACIGLLVNLVCAQILGHNHQHGPAPQPAREPEHTHEHPQHGHEHAHRGHDHSLRAAYVHVLADALTSLTAIAALMAGRWLGWTWMDPLMGIVGALVIALWSLGLTRVTAKVLLDAEDLRALEAKIRERVARCPDQDIVDLHVWRLGADRFACIVSVVTHGAHRGDELRTLLEDLPGLAHVTVEVHVCQEAACLNPDSGA